MRIAKAHSYKTFYLQIGNYPIVGISGIDRPSLYWYWLIKVWRPLQYRLGTKIRFTKRRKT